MYFDQGDQTESRVFVLLDGAITTASYQTDFALVVGETYGFKVTARNAVGSSLDSEILLVLTAKLPDAPINLANVPVITTAYQVGLTWEEGPYNGGSAVIDYQVSFAEESSSEYTIFSSGVLTTSETVTGLTPATTYRFVVQARNIVDLSVYSESILVLAAQIPDPPVNLRDVPEVTSASQIGLTWHPPEAFDGGSPVIDYRLWYDSSTGSTFINIASGLTELNYIVTGLVQGATHQFKIEARNAYGFSAFSDTVTILAAQVPGKPNAPTTVWSPDDVVVSWTKPDNGGSPVTGYRVLMRQSDGLTFSEEL